MTSGGVAAAPMAPRAGWEAGKVPPVFTTKPRTDASPMLPEGEAPLFGTLMSKKSLGGGSLIGGSAGPMAGLLGSMPSDVPDSSVRRPTSAGGSSIAAFDRLSAPPAPRSIMDRPKKRSNDTMPLMRKEEGHFPSPVIPGRPMLGDTPAPQVAQQDNSPLPDGGLG